MADNLQVSVKIPEEKSVNILTLSVVRRDGAITPFKSDKISNAIKKAFLAQTKIRNDKNKEKEQQDGIHKTVEALKHKVVSALTRRIADGDMIHIEDIQDQVELALMRDEHHKVARAYVLYREQRAASRYHTKKLKEQVGEKASSMMVTKRDGSKEPISLDKITNRVSVLSTGLNIDPIVVVQKAVPGLYSDISSVEIDTYLAETASALTVEHPDYSYLAARIKVNSLHKETPGFIIATKNLYDDGLLREEYFKNFHRYRMVMIKIGKSCFYLCGRFPAGHAIRCIFFALFKQKKAPLLSLTQYSGNLFGEIMIQTSHHIKSLVLPQI